MFVYRSLSLGLIGACLLMLATKPTVIVQGALPLERAALHPSSRAARGNVGAGPWECVEPAASTASTATILDVAAGAGAADVARMLHLAPDEHIATVDNAPVAGTLGAGVALANTTFYANLYIDIEVRSPRGDRRILVLLH
jgi:hypothetical protein